MSERLYLCSKCGESKQTSEFYKTSGGDRVRPVRSHCKACIKAHKAANLSRQREYQRKYRDDNRDKIRKYHRDYMRGRDYGNRYRKARSSLNNAVHRGKISKPSACTECGRTDLRIEGHHPDYSRPLDVVWLCTLCHGRRHWKEEANG
jgi:hypothetical protein